MAQTTKRILKLGLVNFWRNKWLSLVATVVMTLTLLIISIFSLLTFGVHATTEALKEKIDLSVHFADSAEEAKIFALRRILETRSDVLRVEYISKEQAYEIWQKLPIKEKTKELVTPQDNPLPRSLQVKARDPGAISRISAFLESPTWKDLITRKSDVETKALVERLLSITAFTRKMGWVLSGVFLVISIMVIYNTIRLTIFTRREEIEIMRLVGATEGFVRTPFLIEGSLYGVIATILASFFLWLGLRWLSPQITQYLGTVKLDLAGVILARMPLVVLFELLVGVFVGVACSWAAIRRYLRT